MRMNSLAISEVAMIKAVLLDTSFFIRLLNDDDNLHEYAKGYFKYFLNEKIILKISVISISEYCVRGDVEDLPLEKLQIIPFNFNHALQASTYANILFKDRGLLNIARTVVANDANLFSQAHLENDIEYFVTSDVKAGIAINKLKENTDVEFKYIDINTPYDEYFGLLKL